MKLRPVTKLDNKNKAKSKKLDGNVTPAKCDVIIIFQSGSWISGV